MLNATLKLNATLNLKNVVMKNMAYLSLPRISRSKISQTKISQTMLQAIAIGSLSVMSFTTAMTMPVPHDNGVVMAQDGDTFERYVRAAFEIEKERRGMMGQVKTIMGGNVPGNVCRNLGQISDEGQRNQVKDICTKFGKFAVETVKKYKLSPQEFNQYRSQAGSMTQQVNEMIQKLNLK